MNCIFCFWIMVIRICLLILRYDDFDFEVLSIFDLLYYFDPFTRYFLPSIFEQQFRSQSSIIGFFKLFEGLEQFVLCLFLSVIIFMHFLMSTIFFSIFSCFNKNLILYFYFLTIFIFLFSLTRIFLNLLFLLLLNIVESIELKEISFTIFYCSFLTAIQR